ncbi:ABC transporter ATP-binding protein [Mobilitalea sibirica]|uniref:ABC transporter ATP-binding protein n=1 Tax=Mobilitalea sibirica TaxID=1462919 RepID=A0A8J7KWU5_9FIRM|nr:ABC transporter ATP-binding protein [Mobilitalea sibirica]MBH1940917.1 ABC transporter ATP-binding protein [Mobilitalea sibirica]
MEHKNEKQNTISTVFKVIKLVKKLKPDYLPFLLITKLIAAGQPFVNIYLGSIILDMIVDRNSVNEIMQYVYVMVGLNFILTLSRWGLEFLTGVFRRIITERTSQMISEKSLSLDYELLEKKETLAMIHKAEAGMNSHGDIGTFCDLLGRLIERIFKIFCSIGLLAGLFIPVKAGKLSGLAGFMNAGYSGLSLLIIIAFTLLAAFYLNRWTGKQEQKSFEDNVESNRRFGYFYNFVWNYALGKDIRLYRMDDMIMDEIDQDHKRMETVSNKMTNSYNISSIISNLIVIVFEVASYIYVGLKTILGLISIGSVLRYISALREFRDGLGGLLDIYVNIGIRSRYLAYFSDFMELENQKHKGTLPIEKRYGNRYEIEFRDVSFHYPNNSEMVLSHVNIKLRVGQKMAVVGKNGAGKTTFIKLLCRLYEPTEGEILLNGINIKEYDYNEYMRLFSIVFQDFQLFSFSLAENVAASLEYNKNRIEHSLEKAGFGERLKDMPGGIDTNIYQMRENGVEISGGEAQKIAIARALYKNSPFVVLDEPTSALDPVSEYDIYKRFDELVKDKTAIYISHRMSSCRFCDHIVVFDEGTIVQDGSHDELLKDAENLYHQLWTAQAQYYA